MKKRNYLNVQKVVICIFLYLFCPHVYANTYYVSFSNGSDNNSLTDAQQLNTPWKTLNKLNAISSNFKPGDSILFKRGDTFAGTLQINANGTAGHEIFFGDYGNGNLPEITGFVTLTNWQQKENGIWETTIVGGLSYLNTVVINGASKAVGRYPNANASEQGYLHFNSFNTNTSITDSKLNNQPNWSGGQIVVRKNRWVLDRNNITSQSGTTINYSSQSGYWADQGYGYFIQNHPSALDLNGEWYYQANGNKFGVFTGSSSPNSYQIKAGTIETLVSINNQSNIKFQNIRFSGAAVSAFEINKAQNISISNCEILFSGKNAINATNTSILIVENSTINNTANIALLINNCSNTTLSNNKIRNTGVNAGMGEGDSGSYEGVLISGDNNLIKNNTIDSTGYIPLTFSGNNVVVQNNLISNFAIVKDDGGGIYTWNNGQNAPTNYGRVIKGNIVLNGIGAPSGTSDLNKYYAHGIYIDDNAGQVDVLNNTVANCALNGIYIHNAHDINIKQNTVYNNAVQLLMEHDNVAANSPVYNIKVNENILFAKLATQLPAAYKTKDNDITNFGTFDNNYYYRPIDNDLVIGVLQQINGVYSYNTLNVDSWKALYGKDANSTKPLHQIAPYKVSNISGKNQFLNGTFDNNINGLYAYAASNNCATNWSNGNLDGGALKISFSSTTNNANYGSVIIGIGAVTAGNTYRLKFSILGADVHKAITTYLRQSAGSYTDLSDRKAATITANRLEKEYLFTATSSEGNASIVFDIPEQSTPLYLDNIQLNKVDVTITNPDNFISFFFNSSGGGFSSNVPSLSYDAMGKSYQNSISVNPFSSLVLVADTSPTVVNEPPVNCAATGYILREEWDNVGGNNISDIPLATAITSSTQLTAFEGPTDAGDNYASRIRGYICPPQNGNYTFWIAGDDAAELWLSTDENPANKIMIANLLSWTNYREWNKFSSQISTAINLQAGKKYYVEALHKEGSGGDNLSVQWQLPNGAMETPIAGSHLSAYVPLQNQIINFSALPSKTVSDAPFAINATASSALAVSFKVVSGQATISNNTVTINGEGNVKIEASQPGDSAYNAATPVVQQFTVNGSTTTTCSATGTILREQWDYASGNNISDIPIQTSASSTSQLTAFEGPVNISDNYGSRIRGYICAPQTGDYHFWVAGDDAAELWLSTDENVANKVKIASLLSWTDFREWTKYASQASGSMTLQAGKKYYVEALHKEGNGGDNLSVKWQLPDGTVQIPLPGTYLSAYIPQVLSNSSISKVSAVRDNSTNANTVNTEILNSILKEAINVFPNPASNTTHISINLLKSTQISLMLYNSAGKLIQNFYNGQITANSKMNIELNCQALPTGIYFINVKGDKVNMSQKLSVLHK